MPHPHSHTHILYGGLHHRYRFVGGEVKCDMEEGEESSLLRSVHDHIQVPTHAHTHTCTHAHTCTRAHTCTHAHTCIQFNEMASEMPCSFQGLQLDHIQRAVRSEMAKRNTTTLQERAASLKAELDDMVIKSAGPVAELVRLECEVMGCVGVVMGWYNGDGVV